ncbi:MAG TPA: SOS response-associated peptidase family protein [Sphingomicrobium sp.]|nr:SOS response-associated peptidase family protein [Sphingomicrobium sp.]
MCNLYRLEKNVDAVRRLFAELQIPLTFPEGIPNFQPRDIRITERAPIVRMNGAGEAELIERRWSWPGARGKPVFNMRSDGREFGKDRCIVLADGFYEFTASSNPLQKKKDCWLFKPEVEVALAGLVRMNADVGESFALLTVPPGPDVSPYHQRGVALLQPDQWHAWLRGSARSLDLLKPSEAGSLTVSAHS